MQPLPSGGWSILVVAGLAAGVLGVLGVAGYVYWIYRDAARRGSDHPVAWAVGAFVLGPLVLVLYLPRRPRPSTPPTPPSPLTKALASIGAGLWVSFVLGALFLPPDPFSQVAVLGSLVITAPLAYVLIFFVPESQRSTA